MRTGACCCSAIATRAAGERHVTFPWGDRIVVQAERYFVATIAPAQLSGAAAAARAAEGVEEIRWFTRAELDLNAETIHPHDLATRLRAHLGDEP